MMGLTKFLNFVAGLAALIPFAIFILLSLPIFIYRWIIINVAAPNLRPDLESPLSPLSSMFGCEFASKNFHSRQSRCSLVTSGYFNGTLSFSAIEAAIERNWIRSVIVTREGGRTLRHPELSQYITGWMGFLFWKEDESFLLQNHVKLHEISQLNVDPEEFARSLTEELLNKPFPENKSPWEIHIVLGYQSDKAFPRKVPAHEKKNPGDGQMSIWILRWHHALADGIAALSLQLESMMGLSLDKEFDMLSKRVTSRPNSKNMFSPFNLIADLGSIVRLAVTSPTPWRVEDHAKEWKQICVKTPFIPIEDIRTIRKHFGVSLTAVLLSCISETISKCMKKQKEEYLPICTVLPLPRPAEERRKLANRFTCSFLHLPLGTDLAPEERLQRCENSYELAKGSFVPRLFYGFCQIAGSHLSAVTRLLGYNRFISVGFSNFPGGGEQAQWLDHTLFGYDVVTGAQQGITGAVFLAFSNKDYIRLSVVAEAGVMTRMEVDAVANGIYSELKSLLDLAKR